MKSKKRVLILGANSYVAKQFVSQYSEYFDFVLVKRDTSFRNYFEIPKEKFSGIDVVINFTAIVHKKNIRSEEYFKVNRDLVIFFTKYAKEAGVKQFLQLSTIAVYGDKIEKIYLHTKENPSSPYGKSKLEADQRLLELQDNKFLVSIIRPPMVYGKDAPGNMYLLIKLIRTNLPLPFKNFENKRSFIAIDNLVNAMYLIIEKKEVGLFLVKDKKDISIGRLSQMLKGELGSRNFFFSFPSYLLKKYISRSGLLSKLYGDLIIDDSHTEEKIGKYALVDVQKSITKMIRGEHS